MVPISQTPAGETNTPPMDSVANSPGKPERSLSRTRLMAHGAFWTVVGGLAIGAAGASQGPTMIERILFELVTPLGLIWLLLLVMTYVGFLSRQLWTAGASLTCWLLLTVAGNSAVSNWLIRSLESPYLESNPFELGRFDALVVLGGGTGYREHMAQFSEGGDRVGLAARLFHAGQTDRIICTGSSMFRVSEREPHVREQAAELLRGLQVPAERIDLVAGDNTFQEMVNLKQFFEASLIKPFESAPAGAGRNRSASPSANDSRTPARVGLITSAYHLRRAMRLAEQNGLKLVPIAADVKGEKLRPSPNWIIPGEGNLRTTKLALKEYLAGWVGR